MNPLKLSRAAVAVALALAAGAAGAVPGYLTDPRETAVTNSTGLCWRSGDWTPDKMASPCDAVPRAAVPAAPIAQAPAPAPAPAPVAAAPLAPPTVIEKITLKSDALFEFNKVDLRPEGQQKLDDLARTAQGSRVEQVVVVGHADRIGSEKYNKDLSERRAEAVRSYLSAKGLDQQRVRAEGHGESEPVAQCGRMGPENGSNKKLVACLQPDRRVEVELLGQREVAGTAETPSSGATAPAPASAPTTTPVVK